jgi:hypothetical protein
MVKSISIVEFCRCRNQVHEIYKMEVCFGLLKVLLKLSYNAGRPTKKQTQHEVKLDLTELFQRALRLGKGKSILTSASYPIQ